MKENVEIKSTSAELKRIKKTIKFSGYQTFKPQNLRIIKLLRWTIPSLSNAMTTSGGGWTDDLRLAGRDSSALLMENRLRLVDLECSAAVAYPLPDPSSSLRETEADGEPPTNMSSSLYWLDRQWDRLPRWCWPKDCMLALSSSSSSLIIAIDSLLPAADRRFGTLFRRCCLPSPYSTHKSSQLELITWWTTKRAPFLFWE